MKITINHTIINSHLHPDKHVYITHFDYSLQLVMWIICTCWIQMERWKTGYAHIFSKKFSNFKCRELRVLNISTPQSTTKLHIEYYIPYALIHYYTVFMHHIHEQSSYLNSVCLSTHLNESLEPSFYIISLPFLQTFIAFRPQFILFFYCYQAGMTSRSINRFTYCVSSQRN